MIKSSNLFSGARLFDVFQDQLINVQNEVDSISKEQFLANNDEQVATFIFSNMEIIPLKLIKEHIVRSEPEEFRFLSRRYHTQVAGVRLEVTVPFAGETILWKMQPSTCSTDPPKGNVILQRGDELAGVLKINLQYSQNKFQSEVVNNEIEKNLSSVEWYLENIKKDIDTHNKKLKNNILQLVKQRRDRLGTIKKVSELIYIPIKKRDGAPDVTPLPIQRKHIKPLASKKQQDPIYGISDNAYQEILKIIRHEGATYESTPKTYAMHNEEELRDIMLAHLNGHFEGQATGETFRKNGKTDISIEFENRAAFVAECKVWHGEQKVLEAIDQLLSYLTWRDVKTALVIYNKEVAGFKSIQEKVPEILKTHLNFISIEILNSGGECRLQLRSEDDTERFIEVHVFIFNLYVKQ